MEINKELLNRGLPKWPQMIVTGKKLTEGQALEIIRRTDSFFNYPSGNNHSFIKKAVEILEFPYDRDLWKIKDTEERFKKYEEYKNKKEEFHDKWGTIETEYVHNSWISCAYIGGTHGWCHPDGTIGYSDNIGKYPSAEEVYTEWCLLVKEFPFIDVGVTLMDGEYCEDNISPVVSFRIKNGEVEVINPEIEDVHKEHEKVENREIDEVVIAKRLMDDSFENAIPLEILKQWHDKIFGVNIDDNYYTDWHRCPITVIKPFNLK